eukprot:scaffold18702_cov54-Phaeocystis_antarctica.AAC.5
MPQRARTPDQQTPDEGPRPRLADPRQAGLPLLGMTETVGVSTAAASSPPVSTAAASSPPSEDVTTSSWGTPELSRDEEECEIEFSDPEADAKLWACHTGLEPRTSRLRATTAHTPQAGLLLTRVRPALDRRSGCCCHNPNPNPNPSPNPNPNQPWRLLLLAVTGTWGANFAAMKLASDALTHRPNPDPNPNPEAGERRPNPSPNPNLTLNT